MKLAHVYSGQNPAGDWLAEKFDGVRAFWDRKVLRTRDTWMAIAAPAWVTAGLPRDRALDGEVFAGSLRATLSLIALKPGSAAYAAAWAAAKYLVFDAPADGPGFEERQGVLAALELGGEHVVKVEQVQCTGIEQLASFYHDIRARGGEGVMLSVAGSRYAFGRTRDLLKIKPCEGEAALLRELALATQRAA